MYTNYDELQSQLALRGVSEADLPAVTTDILGIITDESGGNPYAINDNTAGRSIMFSSEADAWNYMQQHSGDTMAVGLFQLLLNGGMGDAYKSDPRKLLNPEYQYQTALPVLLQNEQKAAALPAGSQERFNAVAGNPWYADTQKAGGPGVPTFEAIASTAKALNAGAAPNRTSILQNAGAGITSTVDFLKKLWSVNGVIIVLGSIGILIILVNIAKGGRE